MIRSNRTAAHPSPLAGYARVILIAITAVFVAWSIEFILHSSVVAIDGRRYFCLFDDAMISMRYAWNFSHGLGLVWNPGEYVQGYSNLLMTMVMSIMAVFLDRSSAVLAVQILGIVFILLSAMFSSFIMAELTADWPASWRNLSRILTVLATLLYYPLVYWSLMGMETGLLAVLLLSAMLATVKAMRYQRRRDTLIAVLLLSLAFFTRMDSMVPALPMLLVLVPWRAQDTADGNRWRVFAIIGLYGLAMLILLAFQQIYYGSPLPNTFTLKLEGLAWQQRLADGFAFSKLFLKQSIGILVTAGVAVSFARRKEMVLLSGVALSAMAYQLVVGGDPWPLWRFPSPVMPLALILSVYAIVAISRRLVSNPTFALPIPAKLMKPLSYTVPLIATLVLLLHADRAYWAQMAFRERPYQATYNEVNINTAVTIRNTTTADATVAVYWAGAIPYYAERTAIDMLGKNDARIASLRADVSGRTGWSGMRSVSGHNKYDLGYSIIDRAPTVVQGFVWGTQDISAWATKTYVYARYKGVPIFVRKDSPSVCWDMLTMETDSP